MTMTGFMERIFKDYYSQIHNNFNQYLEKGIFSSDFVQENENKWSCTVTSKTENIRVVITKVQEGFNYSIDGNITDRDYHTHVYTKDKGISIGYGIFKADIYDESTLIGWGEAIIKNNQIDEIQKSKIHFRRL